MPNGQTPTPQTPQTSTQAPMGETLGMPGAPSGVDYYRWLLAQRDMSGMTGVGTRPLQPSLPPVQQPRDHPTSAGAGYSYGTVGERQRAELSNFVNTVKNVTERLGAAIQQKKQRETMQTFDRFNTAVQGINDAQTQQQQARQLFDQAATRLQANPNDEEAVRMLEQSRTLSQQAKEALQINQTILRDEYNPADPKGAKRIKMLQKGIGIDDKNAGSPERQAAIQSIQKRMGNIGQGAAGVLARQPQAVGLSPEGRAQVLGQQAGVWGKPATGGQVLGAMGKQVDQRLKAENMANQVGLKTEEMVERMRKETGIVPVRDADGKIARNPDGTMKIRNLELSEMSPEESMRYQDIRAQMKLRTAQTEAVPVRAAAAKMNAQANMKRAQQASDPAFIQAWARILQDPTQKANIGNVPSQARGPVVQEIGRQGGKLAIPLTGDEIKRMDLGNNAVENIERAQQILRSRPDMFGPAGWGGTKFELALNGGDPDALDFQAAINLANLPAVGVHGVRGRWALEDLKKLDGNLYLNSESMTNVLNEIHRSASEFRDLAARPKSIRGGAGGPPPPPPPSGPTRPPNVPADYVHKVGPQGSGWYPP